MQAALPLGSASAPTEADVQARTALDDPAEWPAFGHELRASGDWESQVCVEGIHCAACAFTIEDALLRLPGVRKVTVNAASRRARVVWSPSQVQPSRWFAAVAEAGYRFAPAADASLRIARQKEARRALFRWLVAGLCMMQVMMYALPAYVAGPGEMTPDIERLLRWASWVLTLPVMAFACGPFFGSAWRDLRHGRIGMDVPVALGMAIAFVVSTAGTFDPEGPLGHEVYFDSLTMFVFFLLTGRWLESRLRDRTAGALDALAGRLPETADRRQIHGGFERVPLRRVQVGDVLRVRPGEAFPVDGIVVDGDTLADEALLTGESRPVAKPYGETVHAGSHNLSAPVLVLVRQVGNGTRFAQIVALMESAAMQRPRLAAMADRIARPFLLAVVLAAGGAALWWWPVDPGHALMVAVSVLIVTCPCALSLATPAAMLASAGALARRGVLVAHMQALESLATAQTVVFDKTGTLTRGTPRLDRVYSRRGTLPGDALELAVALAEGSLHPAARALRQAWDAQHRLPPAWRAEAVQEQHGQGMQGTLWPQQGDAPARRVRLGSAAFCEARALETDAMQVHLSDDEGWVASFALAEDLRPEAPAAIAQLKAQGLSPRLLSGDREAAAQRLAASAGIDTARGGCSPEDKLHEVRRLQAQGRAVAMVGDGLNDGPVIAQADASFAFGNAVPLTQARADFVVLADSLQAVPDTVAQARRTLRIVRQNLVWSATYNALCVPLALAGWLPAWLAGLGMALSSLVVVLNSARLSRMDAREIEPAVAFAEHMPADATLVPQG